MNPEHLLRVFQIVLDIGALQRVPPPDENLTWKIASSLSSAIRRPGPRNRLLEQISQSRQRPAMRIFFVAWMKAHTVAAERLGKSVRAILAPAVDVLHHGRHRGKRKSAGLKGIEEIARRVSRQFGRPARHEHFKLVVAPAMAYQAVHADRLAVTEYMAFPSRVAGLIRHITYAALLVACTPLQALLEVCPRVADESRTCRQAVHRIADIVVVALHSGGENSRSVGGSGAGRRLG